MGDGDAAMIDIINILGSMNVKIQSHDIGKSNRNNSRNVILRFINLKTLKHRRIKSPTYKKHFGTLTSSMYGRYIQFKMKKMYGHTTVHSI